MTPDAARCFDEYESARSLLSSFQYFDLRPVRDMVLSMAEDLPADAPLLWTPPPAPRTVIMLDDGVELFVDASRDEVEIDHVVAIGVRAVQKDAARLRGSLEARRARFLAHGQTELATRVTEYLKHCETPPETSRICLPKESTVGNNPFAAAMTAACELMAQQNLVVFRSGNPLPRGLRRRAARAGCAIPSYHVLDFARTMVDGPAPETGDRPSGPQKALHYVVGHWRCVDGPKSRLIDGRMRTWVIGHWRGDPSLGVVTKGYVAGRRFLASLSRACSTERPPNPLSGMPEGG